MTIWPSHIISEACFSCVLGIGPIPIQYSLTCCFSFIELGQLPNEWQAKHEKRNSAQVDFFITGVCWTKIGVGKCHLGGEGCRTEHKTHSGSKNSIEAKRINVYLPSWELTYPFPRHFFFFFLYRRWDMLVPWRVLTFHWFLLCTCRYPKYTRSSC